MIEIDEINRWALPDLPTALIWSNKRLQQGISVALDSLGEYAQSTQQAEQACHNYIVAAEAIKVLQSNCIGIALKLSAIGLTFDKNLAEKHLRAIVKRASELKVPLEIDMEGTPSVDATCKMTNLLANEGFKMVLALQVYLDRTESDLEEAIASGLKVRLVKGAYKGDLSDFHDIQNRFIKFFDQALASGKTFDVGTHDPELLAELKNRLNNDNRKLVTFGFLKGLADKTKLLMKQEGFQVAEYVPFGDNRTAYEKRREIYLKSLASLNRKPAP